MVATLLAAFAPAAGTAVSLPKIVETALAVAAPAPAVPPVVASLESPELLALGAEVDAKLHTYRSAAASLAEARAIATRLWPEPAADLIVVGGERRGRYVGCYEEEEDFEGNQWPAILAGAGSDAPLPRYIATAGELACLLDDVRDEPDAWESGFEQELIQRIGEAELYQGGCLNAVEQSGIEQAKMDAEICADALLDLTHEVQKHPPRTIAGVLIHARALAGYADAEKDGFMKAPGQAAAILGRELADGVLRCATSFAQAAGSLTHAR